MVGIHHGCKRFWFAQFRARLCRHDHRIGPDAKDLPAYQSSSRENHMNTATLLWLIIFAISAAIFFIVAGIVAIKGVSDLRDLLRTPDDRHID